MFQYSAKGISQLEKMSSDARSQRSIFSASTYLNRALSIRSGKASSGPHSDHTSAAGGTGNGSGSGGGRKPFSLSSLRGSVQPELSRRLWRLIKSANGLVARHEQAGRERVSLASQLSEWGEQTGDEAVSDLSDKVAVLLGEVGEQEVAYARGLDGARSVLKAVRDTERSVQPSRDARGRIADDIRRLRAKEPGSPRLPVLEQELVRAEAENLVAEAQLRNTTRRKFKEAYDAEFIAIIERAEKQILLAKHGRRLLPLLDDDPMTPGDRRRSYTGAAQARQVLNDAEDDIKSWSLQLESPPVSAAVASAVGYGAAGHGNEAPRSSNESELGGLRRHAGKSSGDDEVQGEAGAEARTWARASTTTDTDTTGGLADNDEEAAASSSVVVNDKKV